MSNKNYHVPKKTTKFVNYLDKNKTIKTSWIINGNLTDTEKSDFIQEVTTFCNNNNLTINAINGCKISVSGKAKNFNKAFSIDLKSFVDSANSTYHANTEPLTFPTAWNDKLESILGLTTCKFAGTYVKQLTITPETVPTTFNPLQLASLYNFPTGNGLGQKVGIIELGGGYVMSDITHYLSSIGITTTPNITAVSVDGAVNNPSDTSGANVEVVLDIEIIVALVPNATIRVYFAPNTDQGFYDAIHQAVVDGCSIVSISWGAPESEWASSSLTSFNSLFQSATTTSNVTILVAAGDNGSSDGISGNNVDFPASSPYALACGGTRLTELNATTIASEVVWDDNSSSSATGGGLSKVFSKPSYQSSLIYPLGNARGVPDVSGDADPNTGYQIYVGGQSMIVGGTSAVAPLWSGLLARINQSRGVPCGFIQPFIYANPSVCHDITQGNNGSYSAGVGWDPCTGNGSPNGQLFLSTLNTYSPVSSTTTTSTTTTTRAPSTTTTTTTRAPSTTSTTTTRAPSTTSTTTTRAPSTTSTTTTTTSPINNIYYYNKSPINNIYYYN